MQTETYRKPQPAETAPIPSSDEVRQHQEQLERRSELLSQAGMRNLAMSEKSRSYVERCLERAAMDFDELKGAKLFVWRRFLPTTNDRSSYTYDSIPNEAIEEIIKVQNAAMFERIEIWTPVGNSFIANASQHLRLARSKLAELSSKIDPMAVGVIRDGDQEHYFPIVRWGEALLPYKKIARKVIRTYSALMLLLVLLPVAAVMFGVAAYYDGIVQHGYSEMIGLTFLFGVLLFVVCMVLSVLFDW